MIHEELLQIICLMPIMISVVTGLVSGYTGSTAQFSHTANVNFMFELC